VCSSDLFWDWLLNFWMGKGIDQPSTQWQEMFLPSEAGRNIADWEWTDASGARKKLVSAIDNYYVCKDRLPILDSPPPFWSSTLVPAILLAIIAIALIAASPSAESIRRRRLLQRKPRLAARNIFYLYQSALGLFFGVVGSLLFFLTFISNHDYAWHNLNIAFDNPLFFALVPAGILAAFSRKEKTQKIAALICLVFWVYIIIAMFITLILTVTGVYIQDNRPTLLLLMPTALCMVAGNIKLKI
jgi:dolichyl-phosphate-mannose--protein O-mannosyl transferase